MNSNSQRAKRLRKTLIRRLNKDGNDFDFSLFAQSQDIDARLAKSIAESLFARMLVQLLENNEISEREQSQLSNLAKRLEIDDRRQRDIEKQVRTNIFRKQVREAQTDGVITPEELKDLRELRIAFGLDRSGILPAEPILREPKPVGNSALQVFVEGLKNLFFGEGNRDGSAPTLNTKELAHLQELPLVCRLSGQQRSRFVELCGIFLEQVSILGMENVVPTPEERVKIAASCSLLYVGREEWPFPPVRKVYISIRLFDAVTYQPIDEDNHGSKPAFAGYYCHASDAVYFSRQSISHSFTNDRDGYHLGLHEFAHALDGEDGACDSQPAHMLDEVKTLWGSILERERSKAGGADAALRKYGSTSLREAFATSVECFFEQPLRLRQTAPDLYVLLAIYLNQDPAGHDELPMKRLFEAAEPTIKKYKEELLRDADIRIGKLFMHSLKHWRHRGWSALFACYRKKNGSWSVPKPVKHHLLAENLPREPKTEAPVTLEIVGHQPRRISRLDEFPPLLPSDIDVLLAALEGKLSDASIYQRRAAIIHVWNSISSQAT